MLKFYDVDDRYVKFLQSHDKQVPNITYFGYNKFICGIVLSINGCDYYAPISSNKNVYRTSYPITASGIVIATIRFCFMFPAPLSVLTEKDFAQVRKTDNAYADLLLKQWRCCQTNYNAIMLKAQTVYKIGCNKNHYFNHACCDFKMLESVYTKFV